MIDFRQGNLLKSNVEALVNAVNCVGVMGKGIALQFKQSYPDNFRQYERECKSGKVRLGQMFVFRTGLPANPKFIVNFPTKQHWKTPSAIEDVRSGLVDLVRVIRENAIRSVALPRLGCGNGGLNWADVFPLIESAVAEVPDVDVLVYASQPTPSK